MEKEQYSQEEMAVYIDYILQNDELEKAVSKWAKHPKSDNNLMGVIEALVRRDKECGGLIISVECDEIPTGAENIVLFSKSRQYYMHRVEGLEGHHYIMVFTSKKKFKECEDTSGVVMFIKELFAYIEQHEDLDGIIFNLEKEGMVCGKDFLRVALCMMQKED